MMKDLSRALRRHHAARLKKKRQYYYGWTKKLDPQQLGKVLNAVPSCSCYMCGNPRKYFKERSVQEKRWMQVVE
jgi:hypothetical protein